MKHLARRAVGLGRQWNDAPIKRALSVFSCVFLLCTTGSISGCSNDYDDSTAEKIHALAQQKKNDEIVSLCDQELKTHPDNAYLFASRGVAQLRMSKADLAKADLQKAIALNYKVAWYHRELGNVYVEQRDFKDAMSAYETSLRLNSGSVNAAKVLVYRAAAYMSQNEPIKAVADTTEAIKREPNQPYAYVERANAYYVLYEYERGLADANKAIELGDKSQRAYLARLKQYLGLGDYAKARTDAQALLNLDKNDWQATEYMLAIDLCTGDTAGAIEMADHLIELYPESALGYVAKASCLFFLGDFEKASKLADKALAVQPESQRALQISALLAAKAHDSKRVYQLQGKAESLEPSRAMVARNMALALLFLGSYQEAIAQCNAIILRDAEKMKQANIGLVAKSPTMYRVRSEAHRRLKMLDEAEADMKKALEQGYLKSSVLELYLKVL